MVWGALIGAGVSLYAASKAGDDEGKAARKRRAFGVKEVDENIRRKTNEHEYTLGYNRTQVAGSGVTARSDTVRDNVTSMESEFGKQTDWMRYAAETGFDSDIENTRNIAKGRKISAGANLITALGNAWGNS